MSAPTPERRLGAQRLAQYVTRRRCERYLRLALFPSEAAERLERLKLRVEPLSPLLSHAGTSFERQQIDLLRETADVRDMRNRSAEEFLAAVTRQPAGQVYYDQPQLIGRLGRWDCEGRADLVSVDVFSDGRVSARILDLKASRRESIGYRLQVAFYARLLRQSFADAGLGVALLEGAIVGLEAESVSAATPFDLDVYEDEIARLVVAQDSDVERVVRKPFEELEYDLGPACDGCPHNALCFVDTAEREDLSLVPTITPSEKRHLMRLGLRATRDLAALLEYTDAGLSPPPHRAADLDRAERGTIRARLPVLVQRAKAAIRRLDRSVDAKPFLLGADFGSLPDPERYPDLVRLFIDTQRDYLEDRLYLVAAVVAGPRGREEFVVAADGPPDTDDERSLLLRWIQDLLPALRRCSEADTAPVHVYLFDRRGQSALLDALARHFDALCAIPALYDLLTSQPALSQSMLSFLADEIRERQNIGAICQNLYQVAAEMGFQWSDGDRNARAIFRARVFDNWQPYERDSSTGLLRRPAEAVDSRLFVEAAARFGVEIPLEYAYAAWGELAETGAAPDGRFDAVSLDDIRWLGTLRCRALEFIEGRFTFKNRRIEKLALDLGRIDSVAVDPAAIPFRRTLEDFLLLEHHAVCQERMLRLAAPPDVRAQTGRTTTIRCVECATAPDGDAVATFQFISTGNGGIDEPPPVLRFKEGDWGVLNPLEGEDGEPLPPWRLVRGRLVIVDSVGDGLITLRLMSMTFRNSLFRFSHSRFTPEPGSSCVLDEMLDDLNADKYLEACRHAETNVLYRWMEDPELGSEPRMIRPIRLRAAVELADLAARSQAPHGLTRAQRRIIGEHLRERVLVVQGPPGTGKSHTLGFAVLVRALALATAARPFRVAVLAKTHAATNVALESIARRARQLLDIRAEDTRVAPLAGLKLAKVCNSASDAVPTGVERVLASGSDELRAREQWYMLLQEPLFVVGATPGGLYNLLKQGAGRGSIDWREEYFDLVVVDEASQMGIAEALTAAAVLREDGQFIAIGDHRQMPPILAHAWDRESRRDLARARPHLAIFDYLREAGFATAALDESFRVPAEVADFLRRYVYSEDGIDFRSSNRERLPDVGGLDGWLAAVFDPALAIVLVEHDETASQQFNDFEASLCEAIAGAARARFGLNAARGLGIVVPHTAQRALLRNRLPGFADAVDTVERFQGGERDVIVVSATVSDRDFAERESGFLLEPRRLTVALSRPRKKLIVVASRTMFELIPGDLDDYERGALWKHLRHACRPEPTWRGIVDGHGVRVFAVS